MNANAPFPRPEIGKPKPVRRVPATGTAIATIARVVPRRSDAEFLPAALEVLETPPSPIGVVLIWVICALFVGALTWGYFGRIDIIATAHGKFQPTGRVKVIQPVETGRVVAINVVDGQTVTKGQPLVVLDSGEADAEAQQLSSQLVSLRAEILRRRAAETISDSRNLKTAPPIAWPGDIPKDVQLRENRMQESDLGQLAAEIGSLEAQKAQKRSERDRYTATANALTALVATLQERVGMRATLSSNGSGSKADLINATEALQTQQASLATAHGQEAEARASLDVIDRTIDTSYQKFSAQNMQKLSDAERQADEFQWRLAKARVKQHQLVLESPSDGIVSALAISTLGQVVASGEEVMRIVPAKNGLEIEAHLTNQDIGFVHVGQEAVVKVDSMPFTRYGSISATVTQIANDAISEPDANQTEANPTHATSDRGLSGASHVQNLVFPATLVPNATGLMVDGDQVAFSPGMTVTVEIKTGSRRILEYIFAPLVEVASNSMKER